MRFKHLHAAADRPRLAPSARVSRLPAPLSAVLGEQRSRSPRALGRLVRRAVAGLLVGLLLGASGGMAGCATSGEPPIAAAPAAPADYAGLLARVQEGDFARLDEFRRGWLAQPDAGAQLERLNALEQQALQMFDQPLRLGAIGAALLDVYPASLAGQMASATYYERVSNVEDAARYKANANAIASAMAGSAMAGSAMAGGAPAAGNAGTASPVRVLSIGEASAFLRHRGITSLGSIYGAPSSGNLQLSLIGSRSKDESLVTTTFDITDTFLALTPEARAAKNAGDRSAAMQRYIGERLRQGDSAARTFVAMTLLAGDRHYRNSAIGLLQQAVSDGNLYARLLLVQSMLADYASTSAEDRTPLLQAAVRQLEQAVAAGSEAAMLELGRLQLSGLLGEEGAEARRVEGLAHVRRAAELAHVPAMLVLAGLYAEGTDYLPKDVALATDWLRKAAQQGDSGARLAYARFQLAQEPASLDAQGLAWLRELAAAKNADAMFMIGSLHARGEHLPLDVRLARQTFRDLVALNPTAPEPVNNVAWTLTVSDIAELRDPRRALDMMSKMMTASAEAAANPAYLDTWAAAHAATGRFERAIELQEAALAAAVKAQDEDTAKVLREHLEAFRRGETITEKVP